MTRRTAKMVRRVVSRPPSDVFTALSIVALLESVRPRLSRSQWRGVKNAALGVIDERRARSTGTLVRIVPAEEFESDPSVGRYGLVCVDHGGCVVAFTLAQARHEAARPEDWCPTCQDNERKTAHDHDLHRLRW